MKLPRRTWLKALLAGVLGAGALSLWFRWVGFMPAAPDLSRADPEVSTFITAAIGATRWSPFDAAARAELGMAYEANGFDDLARRCYEQAVRVDATSARWWYRLAVVAGRRGDHDAALTAVDRTIALDPGYAPAHWQQGRWWFDKGDTAKAEASFQRALALAPGDRAATAGLARVLLGSHKFENAASVLEPAVADNGSDFHLRQLLGAAYRGLGRTDTARIALVAGSKGEPVYRDPWSDELARLRRGYAYELSAAESLYRDGQYDAATTLLQKLLAGRPNDAIVLKYLGAAYVERGRPDEAIDALTRSLAANASQADAHINLASAYLQKHATDDGLKAIERALALNPSAATAYQIKGMVLRDAGRLEPALEAFATATRLNPDTVTPRLWTGWMLRQLNRRREAIEAFEGVLDKDPTSADALGGVAMLRLDQGALQAADDAIRRGLDLDRRNAVVVEARARLWKLEDAKGGRRSTTLANPKRD